LDQDLSQNNGFSRLALFLYQCLVLVSIPIFFIVHCSQRAQIGRFIERLGFGLGAPSNAPTLWFHAASLGEIKQIEHVAKDLHHTHGYAILVTTFTQAGAQWVQQHLPFATHRFAPIDMGFIVRRILATFRPEQLAIIENDLWPCMLATSKNRVQTITMLNARGSSSRKRRSVFHRKAMAYFDTVTCSSQSISNEFEQLDFPKKDIHQIGSLKSAPTILDNDLISRLRIAANNRKIWVAASTHASDEKAILDAIDVIQKNDPNTFLIWAPRHHKRVNAIQKALTLSGQSYEKRSEDAPSRVSDVFILDSLGELESALFVSDIVYLGGGLADEGGHNPYEPAQLQKPILSGPKVANHQDSFDALKNQGIITFVSLGADIAKHVLVAQPHEIETPVMLHNQENVSQTVELLLRN